MEPVNLFDLAAKQSQWLAVRQSAIAGNVANANTPGYTAMDVEPFDKVLDRTAVSLISTDAGHLATGGTDGEKKGPGRALAGDDGPGDPKVDAAKHALVVVGVSRSRIVAFRGQPQH